MTGLLKNKIAIVTGGDAGIGEAIARAYGGAISVTVDVTDEP